MKHQVPANFWGVNSPTVADFRLPIRSHWMMSEEDTGLASASVSCLQHRTAFPHFPKTQEMDQWALSISFPQIWAFL